MSSCSAATEGDATCTPPAENTAIFPDIIHWYQNLTPSFAWHNFVVVSFSTISSTLVLLTILYFWWANRQFHFRKRQKDGSRLSQVATKADALEYQRRQRLREKAEREQQGDTDDCSDSSSLTDDDDDDNKMNDASNNNNDWEEDLSDYETDSDDEEHVDNSDDNEDDDPHSQTSRLKRRNSAFLHQFPAEKRQQVKDLTAVVSQMEVFSYLSSEAFVQCLEYMEYVDLPGGQLLFDENTMDGALYAVVQGQVKCQFQLEANNNNDNMMYGAEDDDNEEDEPFISFTAGNGDVVTSLLSMLTGLVRHCQEHTDVKKEDLLPIVPKGISVRAIGVSDTTKLVKVPTACFLDMLDKFPHDVHQISQTIIARMQRVVLQTVVRTLGLHKEIVRRTNPPSSSNNNTTDSSALARYHPETWQRLQSTLQNFDPDAALHKVQTQVAEDAALIVAAHILGGPKQHHHEQQQQQQQQPSDDNSANNIALKNTSETLHAMGSIVSLPPGQTLLEIGELPEAVYIVLQGALDVGMHVPGANTGLGRKKQSKRRASVIQGQSRRSIFPHTQLQTTGTNATPTTEDGGGGVEAVYTKGKRKSTRTGQATNNATPASQGAPFGTASSQKFSRIYQSPLGDVVGQLSCFTGDCSIVKVKNSSDWEPALLYKIPKSTYDSIVAGHPSALTECLGSILDRLGSPIVCLLDYNVEWLHVQAGEDVIQKGENCDALYAVLNGRLRAAVAPQNGHFSGRVNAGASVAPQMPTPEAIGRNTSTDTTSFLSRAKLRLKKTGRVIATRMNKNKPKVAAEPPPLTRRMMNAMGEEAQGEEFGRGSIIGEVEILTGADWAQDIYASRHSELARVPVNVLNAIIRMCPRAGLHLAKVVASQIQRKANGKTKQQNMALNATMNNGSSGPPMQVSGAGAGASPDKPKTVATTPTGAPKGTIDAFSMMPSYGLPLATIAVIPLLEGDFDLDGFCQTLQNTLHNSIAPTKLMTKAYARQELGEEVFRQRNAMHSLKMTRLCGDLEENYRLVVYQADSKYTWWTRFCIQQADRILLVVRAEKAPPEKQVEGCLSWAFAALNVKIQLVVLQNSTNTNSEDDDEDLEAQGAYESMESSDELNDWSEQRYWIAGHHAIRTPFRKHMLDFRRLCRRVTGRSIGLVLGGGGARGLAHIGVIKALIEAGITIDFVGGTSQGAYIGALYAMNPDDYSALVVAARRMANSMSNNWEKLRDLTLPLVSFFCGYRFNRGIQKSLGLRRIQDLVCNFFCVSVDLRNNMQVVHTKGVCWRYVRASMTLQSYLPPLSEDGTLLVDGGYMNVLPADVMKKQMRARTVIAVDVSQEVILDNYEYGSHLNGWWLLYNSWNPFTKTVKIPSMGDISERLAWVNGDRQKKKVREHIDLFLQPPVSNYGVLEFDKFDEIVQLGYEHAKPRVDKFVAKNPHLVS